MNNKVVTSISLLSTGVIIGVVACVICLTTFEWQKASRAKQMHNANQKIAVKASTESDTKGSKSQNRHLERNLHIAHASSHASGAQTGSQKAATGASSATNSALGSATNSAASSALSQANSQSNSPLDPATRTVIPNILHQAVQTAPMPQWGGSGITPANGMLPGNGMAPIQVMPTTYIIQQPVQEIIVPGDVGPNRAVHSADAIPMPIGANGLQQNPCVDPSSSYGRAYNRNSSY